MQPIVDFKTGIQNQIQQSVLS